MLTKRKTGDGLHAPGEGGPAGAEPHASRPVPLRAAALAALLAMGAVLPLQAYALGLGRVTVLSALGEPLKADVDVVEISADEASSLTVNIAPAAAFRAAGVDYNTALTGARVSLQQRADGSRYLRISGDRSVNEPYLDLILEANWASGRLTRDYTLLFDPAHLRAAPAPAPLAAQIPAAPAAAPTAPPPAPAPAPAAPPMAAVEPVKPAAAPAPVAVARPAPHVAVARAAGSSAGTVTVRPGDTAAKLVAPQKADGVSLDQLLIALLRANPDAFIGGNVNRLRAGAVVDLPSAEQAQAVSPAEARRLVAVQSSDFNDFRRRLATATPATAGGAGGREASGRVQTQVQESTAAAAAPDKLKLSKGAVKPGTREAQVAQSREKQEATTRVAELEKNLGDLAKLQASSAAVASAAAPTQKASGPAIPVGTPVAAAASAAKPASAAASAAKPASAPVATASAAVVAPAASAPASAAVPAPVASAAPAVAASAPASAPAEPASAVAPAAAASAPASVPAAPKPPVKKVAPPPPPPPEPSFIDSLMDNPLVPAGLVGLVALLGGYGFYRMRQRKAAAQADSSFLESRVQPDSFFGSSGGQHVDTNDESPPSGNGSSLNYSPSQLDAGGDVDPVAEADVYLAYGRDLQAEEILKEALKAHPGRIAIHAKLLEIHAKRRDARAFEVVARQAYKLSQGQGPEWEHICELGRSIDAENPLYQQGGAPKEPPAKPEPASAAPFAPSTMPVMPKPEFAPSEPAAVNLDFDLDLGGPSVLPDDAAASAPEPLSAAPAPVADFDFTASPAPAAKPAAKDSGLLEFDLSDLSLDLPKSGGTAAAAPAAPVSVMPQGEAADSYETKLSLAKEFHEIGDVEGARVLVEEVIANASGPLKAKAQRFLAELS